MKCIVTGGSGFIGTHLVSILLESGWDVAVLDIVPPRQKVKWLHVDLRDRSAIDIGNCEYVFHLAAIADAKKCASDPFLCFETNVIGTLNLLHAARESSTLKRFVLASSTWLSKAIRAPVSNETHLVNMDELNSIYSASKLAQETLCRTFRAEFGGPDFTILRYGSTYGEWMWDGLVVRSFIRDASTSSRITIRGDGNQSRELLYVRDLCKAHLNLDTRLSLNSTYDICGDSPITIRDLATKIAVLFPGTSITYVPATSAEPNSVWVKNDAAKRDLQWTPHVSLEDGIAKCIIWWEAFRQTTQF